MSHDSCAHGVRLMGKDPPPCLDCELLWCESMLTVAEERHERAKRELADVRERIAARHTDRERG